MGRAHYLTIRCPTGCEAWLQPAALEGHLGRCRQHPWVDDLMDSVVIPAPLAPLLLSVLPEEVVDEAEHPEVGGSRRNDVGFDFRFGRRIRSPLEGVRARRWLYVATAVLQEQGLRAVHRSLTIDGFRELEEAVLAAGDTAECATCGEVVTRRGMGCHRATNTPCRWRRAAHEVREAWDAGWRDPFNVAGAPLTWGELTSRMRWKKRLLTVGFPRWTAVLLKAEVSPEPSGSPLCGAADRHPQKNASPQPDASLSRRWGIIAGTVVAVSTEAQHAQKDAGLPRLMNVDEVAEVLGVNVRHVRRLVFENRIPYLKWGRLVRFDPREIDRWLRMSCRRRTDRQ